MELVLSKRTLWMEFWIYHEFVIHYSTGHSAAPQCVLFLTQLLYWTPSFVLTSQNTSFLNREFIVGQFKYPLCKLHPHTARLLKFKLVTVENNDYHTCDLLHQSMVELKISLQPKSHRSFSYLSQQKSLLGFCCFQSQYSFNC